MKTFRTFASSLVATALLALVGCGSDTTEGAGDGKTGEGASGVCGAAASWKNECSAAKSACDDTVVSACSDVTSLLNASVLEGARSCLEEQKCGAAPTSCLAAAIGKAKKTEAHDRLAKGFCGCLLTGKSACIDAVSTGEGPAKLAVALALPLSDSLADAITEKCTTLPGCAVTFPACAQGVITAKLAEKLSVDAGICLTKSVLASAPAAGGDGTKSPDGDDGTTPPSCAAKTCEDFGGMCGSHGDGCGGTVDCGECKPACTPKTCGRLGKTCGTADDGCGGTVNCGPCTTGCSPDAKEPNDSKAAATDLGTASDNPNTIKTEASLASSDGDEDWFKLRVTDGGFGGNPTITATVTGATGLEVVVFHVCDSQPDYSYCDDGGTQDNSVGKGCRGTGKIALKTDCSGLDETGTTYVRVRKLASNGKCESYSLSVAVD